MSVEVKMEEKAPDILSLFARGRIKMPKDGHGSPREKGGAQRKVSSAGISLGRVLVLYTGGTIGMIRNQDNVLAPAKNCLAEFIKRDSQMHDATYDYPEHLSSKSLILPSAAPNLKRVAYEIHEYDVLLDSSNIDMSDWIRLSCDIKKFYSLYDGFVVLHGTDTLAYTASALSFMLENLGKPVIITGSQVPMVEPTTDGRDNLICSVAIAGNFHITEVAVFFNHGLFRGNRVTKHSTNDFCAFHSFNYPPLAKVGTSFEVDYRLVMKPSVMTEFSIHPHMSDDVCLLKIYPGIKAETVKSLFEPPVKGVVIQSFGAGNMPNLDKSGLLHLFHAAIRRGIILVNVIPCPSGAVCAAYETGKAYYDMGVLPGYDMTPEAAFAKLSYVLSKDEWTLEEKKKNMVRSLRGELSGTGVENHQEHDLINAMSLYMDLSSPEQKQQISSIFTPAMVTNAIANADFNNLSELRDWGADFNACNADGRTPLHIACYYGNVEVVQFLLSNGANIHIRDRQGRFPLDEAIFHSPLEVLSLLIENGARLGLDEEAIGTELCRAAGQGDVDRLERLVVAGADLNASDIDGRTPLHMACIHEQLIVTRFLLHKEVKKDKLDILGNRPIDYARHMQNADIISALQAKLNSDRI